MHDFSYSVPANHISIVVISTSIMYGYLEMISTKTTNCTRSQTCQSIRFSPMYTSRKNSDGKNTMLIVYSNPEVEFHHTYVSYDILTLVGELGGLLGMTMGCSGLSIIESIMNQISRYRN